jgi:hypothetical protein
VSTAKGMTFYFYEAPILCMLLNKWCLLQLRCDVVQEPFTICTRCQRLKLDCKIESNFKRVGKRSRNAEMEREIVDLRKQIANMNAANVALKSQLPPGRQETPTSVSNPLSNGNTHLYPNPAAEQFMGSHEAVARNGGRQFKTIEDVLLAQDRVSELFNLYGFSISRILSFVKFCLESFQETDRF